MTRVTLLLLILLIIPTINATTFKLALPNLPEKINTVQVNSFTQYMILEHLLRPLVTLTQEGTLKGDLATSWVISPDFKEYTFKIKETEHFSDNKIISVEDVIESITFNFSAGKTIHFNHEEIDSVVKQSNNSFVLRLKKSNPFFLYDLEHPEFRVLHPSDRISEQKQSFQFTSGIYHLEKKGDQTILTPNKTNPHFNEEVLSWDLLNSNSLETEDMVKKEQVALIWPAMNYKPATNSDLLKKSLNVGFTFWLSLNGETLTPETRDLIATKICDGLNKNKIPSDLVPANQLYLPTGPGRLTANEIKEIHTKKKNPKQPLPQKLRLLAAKNFPYIELIKNNLKSAGDSLEVTHYENFQDYAKLISAQTYDIIQVNNDFSEIDLRSSLQVTFNQNRPLIFTNKKDTTLSGLLHDLNIEQNSLKKYGLIKEIGKKLLQESYIVPLHYNYLTWLYTPNLSLNKLSTIGPDLALWKIIKK